MRGCFLGLAALCSMLPDSALAGNWYSHNGSAIESQANGRGMVRARCGDPRAPASDRIQSCTEALKYGDNAETDILNGLADAYRRAGDYANAIVTYDHILELDASRISALAEKALTYVEAGEPDKVGPILSEITRLGEDRPVVFALRCKVRAVAGVELDDGLKDCDKAIEMRSRDSAAHDARALIELKQGKFQACFDDADSALNRTGHFPSAYYMRGYCGEKLGHSDEAKHDFKVAATQDPDIAATFAKHGVPPVQ